MTTERVHRSFDASEPLTLHPDPVAQWLDWEEQANLVGFRTSTEPVEIDVVSVPRDEVEVHILPGAPAAIVDRFVRGDRVCFPRHPLNLDPSVRWFDAPVSERWTARFTSSRTLALPGPESGAALASLKLATDHPHPDFHQPEKTKLREEAVDAVAWVRMLARVDRLLEPLEEIALVTEVLVVLAAGSETGFMVRDLRLFQDGNYYLPALSLPWVGRQIARANGEAFDSFWGRHFAEAVGRGKARLFARYGLWYETPNPQNLLVQLDPALRPTGTLVFRDVGDGEWGTDVDQAVDVPWTRVVSDLRPETQNSFWAFGDAAENAVEAVTLEAWYALHDAAYGAELARWFPELAPAETVPASQRLEAWNEKLRSASAPDAIARGFQRRRAGLTRGSADAGPGKPAPRA
jgi:hypothetical protein